MADDFWFFVSYARVEGGLHVKRFREEIASLVRSLEGIPEPQTNRIGFLDKDGIEHGDDWPSELSSALSGSRVLVPLYSPTYFSREYCGKEFQAFLDPEHAYHGDKPHPTRRPILPVLWYPVPESKMPDNSGIRDLQRHDDRYPPIYLEKGLYYLMDTPGYDREYKEFCRAFAEHVVEVASPVSLPAISSIKPLKDIPPAFPKALVKNPGPATAGGNLRIARFICGAAKRDEIERQVDAYGAIGGIDWKPFAPVDCEIVGVIAQEAAWREKFLSDVHALDSKLPDHLEDARNRQIVLVVLLDPWSLKVRRYCEWISPCDEVQPCCAIIVTWNVHDEETKDQKHSLELVVRKALPTAAVAFRHPIYFRDTPDTRDRLQTEIQSTLVEVYMRMLQARAAKLGIASDPPPSISNAPGVLT